MLFNKLQIADKESSISKIFKDTDKIMILFDLDLSVNEMLLFWEIVPGVTLFCLEFAFVLLLS